MKYIATVTEILSREVEIEAETIQEAFDKVKELYRNSEIVLDSDDFTTVDFGVREFSLIDSMESMSGN